MSLNTLPHCPPPAPRRHPLLQLRIMNEASAQLPDLNPIVAKMKAEQGTT